MALVKSIFKKGLFSNKACIVTGGGSGIGEGIATELAHLGCRVLIASRKLDRINAAVERIIKNSGAPRELVSGIQCNIRNEPEVTSMVSECLKRYGRLDYLVNNGGGQFASAAADIRLKGWNAVVETNLTGTFLATREAYNQWMSKNGGSIVSITMDNTNGFPFMAHSAASRAGVDSLTKSLALEWITSGVRINVVAVGNAVFSETAMKNYGEAGTQMFDVARRHNPSRRFGNPEEVSGAVCFLFSPAASWITGAILHVGGGGHLRQTFINFENPDDADKPNLPAFSWSDKESKS